MVLFLFFCSGATALVYEVVWSKYLSLMFGSTIYAQTIVLAVFMGGLALGNRVIGARSDLLRRPLAAYGVLEALVGLYAFYFAPIYRAADRLFVGMGSVVIEHPALLFVVKAAVSVSLLFLPTVLMGGTLPLLAAWLQKGSRDAGRWSARFYSTNSLGAVCGAWLAGFWLIRSLGVDSTLEMTAMANLLVGLAAIAVSRIQQNQADFPTPQQMPDDRKDPAELPILPWLTVLAATTGAISMGLEVLASRSLSLIFGASVQAFVVVLMAFILGIALGSAAVASPRLKAWRGEGPVLIVLLSAAVLIGAMVLGIEQWVEIYRQVRTGLALTEMGYRFYQIIAAGFSMVLLGLPAALIGSVLPLSIRLSSGEGFGNRVGRLLTWNTLGAVAGVLFTGFILMPNAGLRNSFNLLAIALCVPVVLLAWRLRRIRYAVFATTLAVALAVSCIVGGEAWQYVMSAGAFRFHESVVTSKSMEMRKKHSKLLFYEDGPDATVSVEQGDGVAFPDDLSLRISGKPEASSRQDMGTQLLLAHLPMLARPGAKDVFVVGLASGITCGGILAYPVERLVIGENCEPVFHAVNLFAPFNRGVTTNPAAKILLEDARTVLKLSSQKYDVITSQPSNPWFASVGSVFSQEFFQTAASRLKPGGIMAQWFHVYEMDDAIVGLVLRTFGTVFPVVEIWDVGGGDFILLGSDRPWDASLASLRKSYQLELVRKDLISIGLPTPEALLGHQMASQRTAFAIAGPGPIQSDAFPILEYDAPLAFFIGVTASGINRFDERTWQCDLASDERRFALANLDAAALRGVFKYETINPELWYAASPKFQPSANDASSSGRGSHSRVPCIFLPGEGPDDPASPNASESLQKLVRARAALRQTGSNCLEQVRIIRTELLAQLSTEPAKLKEERGLSFAVAAARTCLRYRNYTLAKEMLELASKLDAEDPEYGYLQRIFERETAGR